MGLRILHIITRLIAGGAQRNTVMCAAAQVAAGHEVWLAFGPIYGPEGTLRSEAERSGAHLEEVRWMRRAILPVHDVLCVRALRKLIRRVRPDVVHTHSSKAGIVGRRAAWAERVPAVIHTIHGLPFHDRQLRLVHRLYVWAERRAARQCHKLIGITQAMCDAFAKEKIGRSEQFAVVPSGIDTSAFFKDAGLRQRVRAELGVDTYGEQTPLVGIVARLDPLKGQDDLVDVLPQLRVQFPTVKLLMVGDGWHRAALAHRMLERGVQANVVITGLVEPAQVVGYLNAMDVMALPSYQEGQGRTLVEALLCGTAIVGYDAGGIGEVCVHEQTGLLVPVGDKEKLAHALTDLLMHPEKRQRLAQQGRAHALAEFSAQVMVERLERIYQETLASRGR